MSALTTGLASLGVARLTAMAVVAVALLGVLALLALRGGTEPMTLLYSDLDPREAGQITERLDRQHIPYQLGGNGASIMVPGAQVLPMRLALARDGLPSGGSVGYELFDRGDSLTANQFQQSLNQSRALEGELARTIRGISGVRAARVHLVMPRREPFAHDRQEAQASVMLTMSGPGRLDREGVQAILNLVAAAVPGLRPRNIAVVDSRGTLLARQSAEGEAPGAAAQQAVDETRRATELRLSRAVEEMLERSLGPGRVRAEATVEMDYDTVHETQEKFDPEGQVVRSTQANNDNNRSTEAQQGVSVANNLPNADAGKEPAGSNEQRQEEVTNYEVGKTVRTLVHDQAQIRRISLAVLVDGADDPGADGTPIWRARTPEELDRITRLVRSAIGADDKRGDRVEVVNMRFAHEPGDPAELSKGLFGLGLDKSDLTRLAQTGVLGLVAVLALLLVLRPMVVRLTAAPELARLGGPGGSGEGSVSPGGDVLTAQALLGGDGPLLAAAASAALPRLAGPPGSVPATAGAAASNALAMAGADDDESMINLVNIEGQLRASSIRRIAELVDRHPEESLTILRGWMHQTEPG